jgi:putative two-component system response regulator
MSPKNKILIVEDDVPSAILLKEILEQSNYDVINTDDGQMALELAEREKPDMAIIDIMLPTLNGFEVCERMREIKDLSGIPIITLTVLNETHHRIRAIQAGAMDFLTKPFNRLELLAKVKALLKAHDSLEQYELFINMNHCLLTALKKRFPNIESHSHRVAKLSELIAGLMQLDSEVIAEIQVGAMLHDIGMLGIDNVVDSLDDLHHTLIGYDMFIKFNRPIVRSIIRSHHEKISGGGFPDGLMGNEITIPVRIVALCNRFDQLICGVEIKQNSIEDVLSIMHKEVAEGYWDNKVLEKLIQCIKLYDLRKTYS